MLSLQATFPFQAVATQNAYWLNQPGTPSDWPKSALDVAGRTLVAAVANSTRSQHDLVTFRARDKGRLILGAVEELSRTPVVALPNNMATTRDGDVLVPSSSGGGARTGIEILTVAPHGGRVRLAGYEPAGGWGDDWCPARYRQLLPGTAMYSAASFLWMHWRDILPAMASVLV